LAALAVAMASYRQAKVGGSASYEEV